MFTAPSVDAFYGQEWMMTTASDRMGCRFKGPELALHPRPAHVVRDGGSGPADIVTDVSPLGAIQVPSGLELIALGIEVPSPGGYAKIATIISADIAKLAQVRPLQAVRFNEVDLAAAETAYAEQEALIQQTESRTEPRIGIR
jgi:allophanate hydrolase subunit 2